MPLVFADPLGQLLLDPDPFCRHVGRPNCGKPIKGTTPTDRRYTTPDDPTGGPGNEVDGPDEIIEDLNSCTTKIPVCRLSEHGEEGLFHIPGSGEAVSRRDLEQWIKIREDPNAPAIRPGDRAKYERLNKLFATLEEKCDKVYIEACNVGKDTQKLLEELYPSTKWNTNRGTCTVSDVSGESTDWWIDWGKKLPW